MPFKYSGDKYSEYAKKLVEFPKPKQDINYDNKMSQRQRYESEDDNELNYNL